MILAAAAEGSFRQVSWKQHDLNALLPKQQHVKKDYIFLDDAQSINRYILLLQQHPKLYFPLMDYLVVKILSPKSCHSYHKLLSFLEMLKLMRLLLLFQQLQFRYSLIIFYDPILNSDYFIRKKNKDLGIFKKVTDSF